MGPGAKSLAFAFLNTNEGGGPVPVSHLVFLKGSTLRFTVIWFKAKEARMLNNKSILKTCMPLREKKKKTCLLRYVCWACGHGALL